MVATLGSLDYLVLVAAILGMLLIGFRVANNTRDLEAYLLGGRDLPWWAILGSLVATETSTATVLSVPGTAFAGTGMKFLQLAIGYVLGRAIVRWWLLPLYFQGKLSTAYEVLDRRFGESTKKAASLLFLITRNLGDGLRLFLAAVVLQELLGYSFTFCLVLMGVVTIVYTAFGGIRSVIWNDCIQLVIYMLGAVASIFLIASRIPGGWSRFWEFSEQTGQLQVFDFQFTLSEPYTFWAGLLGGAVLTIGTHGTDHMMVQRYLSARTQQDAGRAVFLSGIVVFLQFAIFAFIGVELACFYSHYPEIELARSDRVFIRFIVTEFPQNTGLVGLMLASFLSAAMSTLSSSLNASASAFLNDFYLSRRKEIPPANQLLRLTRWLTVAFGILQMFIGYQAKNLADTVVNNALSIAGFSAGLLLGIFALGVLTQRAGQRSALIGGGFGLVSLLLVQFAVPQLGFKVAFPWLALIGSSTTFAFGLLASLIFPEKRSVTP